VFAIKKLHLAYTILYYFEKLQIKYDFQKNNTLFFNITITFKSNGLFGGID